MELATVTVTIPTCMLTSFYKCVTTIVMQGNDKYQQSVKTGNPIIPARGGASKRRADRKTSTAKDLQEATRFKKLADLTSDPDTKVKLKTKVETIISRSASSSDNEDVPTEPTAVPTPGTRRARKPRSRRRNSCVEKQCKETALAAVNDDLKRETLRTMQNFSKTAVAIAKVTSNPKNNEVAKALHQTLGDGFNRGPKRDHAGSPAETATMSWRRPILPVKVVPKLAASSSGVWVTGPDGEGYSEEL